MKKVLILSAVFILLMTSLAWAETSIGFIDVGKVFNEYEKTKAAKADIKEKEDAFKADVEKRQKQIDDAKKNNVKEEEIRKMTRKMQDELEPKQKELEEVQQKLSMDLQNDIMKATKEVAKGLGIEVVLDKQVFITGGMDLTSMVISKLNK